MGREFSQKLRAGAIVTIKKAFILIVPFAVVAVIASGTYLLSFSSNTDQESEEQASCADNLRQLWEACRMYAQDYDNYLPVYYDGKEPWHLKLKRLGYIKSAEGHIYPHCPGKEKGQSYGYNAHISQWPKNQQEPIQISKIKNPERKVLILDANSYGVSRGTWLNVHHAYRHSEGFNVLFVDGHVEWHNRYSEILKSNDYWRADTELQPSQIKAVRESTGKSGLFVKTDRKDALYKLGEKAEFIIDVFDDGQRVEKAEVEAVLTLDGGKEIGRKKLLLEKEPSKINGALDEPGFLQCAVTYTKNGKRQIEYAAAGYEPEKIKSTTILPDDFNTFWEEGRKVLSGIPMDPKLIPLPDKSDERQESFMISFTNLNNTRIYGYLTVPKNKDPPFPALVTISSAGVGKPGGPSIGWSVRGALCLSMGVHDVDLGLAREKYAELARGRLRLYALQGAPDRNKYFFRKVILGIDRAIAYLAARPDFDGKHLLVFGSSQGGGLALVMAGLNRNVTGVVAIVPGLCDLSASVVDRSPGWPNLVKRIAQGEREEYLRMSAYFDAVNFCRRIKVPVLVGVGFIDRCCPPSSIYSAFNELKGPKRIFNGPLTAHSSVPEMNLYQNKWIMGQLGIRERIPPF